MPTIIETDVLVIGGGRAVSGAALEGNLQGSKVVIEIKGKHRPKMPVIKKGIRNQSWHL